MASARTWVILGQSANGRNSVIPFSRAGRLQRGVDLEAYFKRTLTRYHVDSSKIETPGHGAALSSFSLLLVSRGVESPQISLYVAGPD